MVQVPVVMVDLVLPMTMKLDQIKLTLVVAAEVLGVLQPEELADPVVEEMEIILELQELMWQALMVSVEAAVAVVMVTPTEPVMVEMELSSLDTAYN